MCLQQNTCEIPNKRNRENSSNTTCNNKKKTNKITKQNNNNYEKMLSKSITILTKKLMREILECIGDSFVSTV